MSAAISPQTIELVWLVIGSVFTGLVAANAFFIRRLVDKIDHTSEVARQAASKAESFDRNLKDFVEQIRGIREDLKEMRTLDKQLAKLEAQLQILLVKDGYFGPPGD